MAGNVYGQQRLILRPEISGGSSLRAMDTICDQLLGETEALAGVVSDFTEDQWKKPTPAQGWDSRDTVIHLGMTDWTATQATVDAGEFENTKARMMAGDIDLHNAAGVDFDSLSGSEIWGWFVAERSKMVDAFRAVEPKSRIPWFGPDMGARMFATARLMETWSHGHDVADTLGAYYPRSDRLRSVAHIGVVTRGWSYANRGMAVPAGDVCVTLAAPDSDDVWTWGDPTAADTVSGNAYDFCLAVTQRRHYSETGLVITGELAQEWMEIAQAFAGEPTAAATGRVA